MIMNDITIDLTHLYCFYSFHTFHMSNNSETSLIKKDQNIRPEVLLIWEELDKARNTLYDVKKLVKEAEKENLLKGE